jgi:hypothetical protein
MNNPKDLTPRKKPEPDETLNLDAPRQESDNLDYQLRVSKTNTDEAEALKWHMLRSQQKSVSTGPSTSTPRAAPQPVANASAPVSSGVGGKTWPEIDCRSGRERRAGKDRRAMCDIIFKNLRFGGERRSGKERRKNWKPTA